MKIIYKILIINALITFLTSCNSNIPPSSRDTTPLRKESYGQYKAGKTGLFDITAFLENQINTHLKDVKKVEKTVTINGQSEKHEVVIKDWKDELKLFFNSDINKPAWQDKYQVLNLAKINDTLFSTIQYKALNKNLKTQAVEVGNETLFKISLQANKVDTIGESRPTTLNIFNEENSIVNKSSQTLNFDINSGYAIKTKQKMLGFDEENIEISVKFLK